MKVQDDLALTPKSNMGICTEGIVSIWFKAVRMLSEDVLYL